MALVLLFKKYQSWNLLMARCIFEIENKNPELYFQLGLYKKLCNLKKWTTEILKVEGLFLD
jgi:hypothetical protein